MPDQPWLGDACSLVEAFRRGERSPAEELSAVYDAIERSGLNAWSYLDRERAAATAGHADVTLPFGGVPIGVKELDSVESWPDTSASVPLRERLGTYTSTMVSRLRAAGAVTAGLTTASEFGGVNVTRTVLNGVTHNPWQRGRTPGGSSGGSAAAVAGGLVTLATAGDGGGSIRIPAGFTGILGLKTTYGRIPKGPHAEIGGITSVPGCVSRSVRDTARWLDVTSGYDSRDPLSLPRIDGWEAGLGSHRAELSGLRAAVLFDFGHAFVAPAAAEAVDALAASVIAQLGLRRVDATADIPEMGTAWSLAGLWAIYAELGEQWPECREDLTPEIRFGLEWADGKYGTPARIKLEQRRTLMNERMADLFDQADLVITASNPDVAFAAEGPLPSTFGGVHVGAWNNGRLTIPANIYGSPSISIPAGKVDGLPVAMQVMARHHADALLLDVALAVECECPWPLVAPGAPC